MTFTSGRGLVVREQIFETGSVAINYAELPGIGQPAILLHGIGRSWRDALPLLPAFEGRHVFAPDLRGHGKSGRTPGAYQTRDYAADVIALLKTRVGRRSVIFGHSLGGIVAIPVAANAPELVLAIIVGDSVLSRDALANSMYQELFTGLHKIAARGGSKEQIKISLAKLEIRVPGLSEPVAIGDLPGSETDLGEWADCVSTLDPEAMSFMISGRAYEDFDADSLLPRIKCPTLLLQANAELGGLMSETAIETARGHLPEAEVVRFPLLGHALHLQRAKPVIAAIQQFLAPM